jgi:hypothetical protein
MPVYFSNRKNVAKPLHKDMYSVATYDNNVSLKIKNNDTFYRHVAAEVISSERVAKNTFLNHERS